MQQGKYHHAKGTQRRRKRGRGVLLLFSVIVCIGVLIGYVCLWPVSYAARLSIVPPDTGVSPLVWPARGSAALRSDVSGTAPGSSAERIVPIASTTKLITALAILDKKPLQLGQQGETIRFTDGDTLIYQRVIAQEGAGVPVAPGQSMTELQALQAMLLASANNIAVTLVSWAFGSEQAYNEYANDMVRRMGCAHTHVTGSSGLESDTVSTADDMARIAARVAGMPVLAEITALPSIEVPGFGVIYNSSHITGLDPAVHPLKVGLTDEAGACFAFWLEVQTATGIQKVYGAIFGQPDFHKTLLAYVNAIAQGGARGALTTVYVAHAGEPVATYTVGGKHVTASMSEDAMLTVWKGADIVIRPPRSSSNPALTVSIGQADQAYPLKLNGTLTVPLKERLKALRF